MKKKKNVERKNVKKILLPGLAILLLFLTPFVFAADSGGSFVDNFIPSSITKSLQAIQVFTIDFMAFVLDIFTMLLFILLILLIFGIIWIIYFIVQLPKKLGSVNIQDAVIQLAMKTWEFMK